MNFCYNKYYTMKFITKLSIFLILLASMFFAVKFSSAQEINSLGSIPEDKYPYKIIEVLPSGSNGQEYAGVSDKATLFDIAVDLGANPYEKDKFTVFPELYMQMGGTITIYRTPSFKIIDGKKNLSVRSWAQTVGGVLAENRIELGQDDKINFSEDTEVTDSMQIKIVRVAKTNVIEKERIEYKVIKKEDPNLKRGLTRSTGGEYGERAKTFLVTREDGEEISRVLTKTEVTKEPVEKIEYTGTKVIVIRSVSGYATIGPANCSVVSATYKRGALVRITNTANGVQVFKDVDCTWGTASAPAGIVLDLSRSVLNELRWNGSGKGPQVRVDEIER